jgi:hypothetical protein
MTTNRLWVPVKGCCKQGGCDHTPLFSLLETEGNPDEPAYLGVLCTQHMLEYLQTQTEQTRACSVCGNPVAVSFEADLKQDLIRIIPQVDHCSQCGSPQKSTTTPRAAGQKAGTQAA